MPVAVTTCVVWTVIVAGVMTDPVADDVELEVEFVAVELELVVVGIDVVVGVVDSIVVDVELELVVVGIDVVVVVVVFCCPIVKMKSFSLLLSSSSAIRLSGSTTHLVVCAPAVAVSGPTYHS
jgi:hypothetical protein